MSDNRPNNNQMLGELVQSNKDIVRRLEQLESDVRSLRAEVKTNADQLTFFKAARIILGWLIATALAALGIYKGVDWRGR